MRAGSRCGKPKRERCALPSRPVNLEPHLVLWLLTIVVAALAPGAARLYAARLEKQATARTDAVWSRFVAAREAGRSQASRATAAGADSAHGGETTT